MDVDIWTKWVTLIGAVVAAVSGVWALIIQLRGVRDEILVSLGTLSPEAIPETMMNVVSKSDHPIRVVDFGFIDLNGRLVSIPLEIDLLNLHSDEVERYGSPILNRRGDSFQVGYCMAHGVLGCYARTSLQTRPCMAFGFDTSLVKRARISIKVYLAGSAYLLP